MSFKIINKISNKTVLKSIGIPLKGTLQGIHSDLVISCKRKKYNFYKGTTSSSTKFDEIVLASKGWDHAKSKGDYFTVHGNVSDRDHPNVPWSDIDVHPDFVKALKLNNVTHATDFQTRVIPAVRSGKHTLIAAETGCGKTFSYLLPLLEKIIPNHIDELNTPQILILVPNRELAYQVGSVASKLVKELDLKVQVVVGGRTKQIMMNPEFSSVDVLVGTPGVIGKLSTVGVYKLNQVRHTVLDEGDTLMDDSFVERMEMLLKRVPQSQIVIASATAPRKLPGFLEPIMDSLVMIKSDRLHKPLLNVTQKFLRMTKSAKPSQLLALASKIKQPTIIFTNRNEACNWLSLFLRENNVGCANINGDMNQAIRIEQWNKFIKGDVKVLSATDVGSRGLDTVQVNQVINYDFPLYAADYIHRIGRIGRLGSIDACKVTNFVSGRFELKLVQNIEMAIRTDSEIKNVDGNITHIVQKRILNQMRGQN